MKITDKNAKITTPFDELLAELEALRDEHAECQRPDFFQEIYCADDAILQSGTILAARTELLLREVAENGLFNTERLYPLDTAISSGLEAFLKALKELTGEDLLRPTDEAALDRLVRALKKAFVGNTSHLRGKRYDNMQIRRYETVVLAMMQDSPHITNKKMAAHMGIALGTFKRLGLHVLAAKVRSTKPWNKRRTTKYYSRQGRRNSIHCR
ncbi:MAG: hypothetical protein M0Z50_11695 [Planctomycetia bacterium]|nr:hypothetical protein [Planctomycetia bacterium]